MKVWRIEADLSEEYKSYQLRYTEKLFFKTFCKRTRDGIRFNGEYDNVEIYSTDGKVTPDFAHFWAGGELILTNEEAKNCLEELLNDFVEFVPLKCEGSTFYMMHVVEVIDAVDSKNKVLGKSERGRDVEKYAFIPEKIQGIAIFKTMIEHYVNSTEIYVSSEFKERVENSHLTGVKFTEVKEVERICRN